MKKPIFEYKEISSIHILNDKELNNLGNMGWELIIIISTRGTANTMPLWSYTFKRIKNEQCY
jgi:hypothetical protein